MVGYSHNIYSTIVSVYLADRSLLLVTGLYLGDINDYFSLSAVCKVLFSTMNISHRNEACIWDTLSPCSMTEENGVFNSRVLLFVEGNP